MIRKQQPSRVRRVLALIVLVLGSGFSVAYSSIPDEIEDAQTEFSQEVPRHLNIPLEDQEQYSQYLDEALAKAKITKLPPQYVVLVDSSPNVQAVLIFIRTPQETWHWVGASPVSTGRVGIFNHFRTPLGVFPHSPKNPDFRAEGTLNKNHIRGYGLRGMRVFDFGWVVAKRGWEPGGTSKMRLQMHATDPRILEPRLGKVGSKGCIRISTQLNTFLDRHGILDAKYYQALAKGKHMWILPEDRIPTSLPGRYLVIIDSQAQTRPAWSPLPKAKGRKKARIHKHGHQ